MDLSYVRILCSSTKLINMRLWIVQFFIFEFLDELAVLFLLVQFFDVHFRSLL